jgi:membrane protein
MSNQQIFWGVISSLCFIVLVIYIGYESQRFNGSERFLTNVIVDKIYRKWFKENSTSLTKRDLEINDLNKIVLKLKKELEGSGISQEIVQKYIEYLENHNSTDENIFKRFFAGIIALVSTSNTMSILLDNLFKSKQSDGSTSSIINGSTIESIVFISLILIYFIGIIAIFYYLFNIENRQLSKLRLGLLEQVNVIWNYSVDETSDYDPKSSAINTIYLKETNKKSKFEKKLDKLIGPKVKANTNFVSKCFTWIMNKCKCKWVIDVFDFFLGFILPLFIVGITIFVAVLINWYAQQFNTIEDGWFFIILIIIMIILIILMEITHKIVLNAQIIGDQKNVTGNVVFKNIKWYKYRGVNYIHFIIYFFIYLIGYMALKDNFEDLTSSCIFNIFIVLHCVISFGSTFFFIDDENVG